MKKIFNRIGVRKWDCFGLKNREEDYIRVNEFEIEIVFVFQVVNDHPHYDDKIFSLADLLANESWCRAVWYIPEGGIQQWQIWSALAFKVLQQEGKKACVKYIKKTMQCK